VFWIFPLGRGKVWTAGPARSCREFGGTFNGGSKRWAHTGQNKYNIHTQTGRTYEGDEMSAGVMDHFKYMLRGSPQKISRVAGLDGNHSRGVDSFDSNREYSNFRFLKHSVNVYEGHPDSQQVR
jgi:hypothetical protein